MSANYSFGVSVMTTPSIRPNPNFNAQNTAELLRKAMKGFGCDKAKIIQAIVNCCNAQRQEKFRELLFCGSALIIFGSHDFLAIIYLQPKIFAQFSVSRSFKQMYGKDLIKELKSELSGDFEDLIMALMDHPAYYDASQLRRAMEGLGTKEHILIEIMTTRSNAQILQIRSAYAQLYASDLERDLIGETSGYFKRMLVALCTGARDESMLTDPLRANQAELPKQCLAYKNIHTIFRLKIENIKRILFFYKLFFLQDANKLYRAGERRLGTDESAFIAILSAQNYNQLRLKVDLVCHCSVVLSLIYCHLVVHLWLIIFNEYQKVSGHPIDQAIIAEFSGDIRDGLLAIIKSIRNRPAYFAELLYNSMKGFGTRDNDLIRLVVTRSEIDLGDIRSAYQQTYGTTLEHAIASDCSGAYKDGLIAIVKGFYH
ncbi:Annexin [Meloidogyne graminicola]|uniref:Annexin n=1 Tax=Meloidogyne graminicola TaxID=189291 RepID=A0A8S9ZF40_9BILA|nr:Annexin [Meloidogyne graminicola]